MDKGSPGPNDRVINSACACFNALEHLNTFEREQVLDYLQRKFPKSYPTNPSDPYGTASISGHDHGPFTDSRKKIKG